MAYTNRVFIYIILCLSGEGNRTQTRELCIFVLKEMLVGSWYKGTVRKRYSMPDFISS
jgi:hypothetical protein